MSKDSLDAFRAKLAQDETLRQEASRTFGGGDGRAVTSADEIVAFAKAHGYAFSAGEVRESVELNDKELDAVAGGAIYMNYDGVEGEMKESKHSGEIDLMSWSFGTTSIR